MLRCLFLSSVLLCAGAWPALAAEPKSALGRGPYTALVRTQSGGYAALTYMDVDGLAVFEGDIVLGQHADVQQSTLANIRAMTSGLDPQVIGSDTASVGGSVGGKDALARPAQAREPLVLSIPSIWPKKTIPFTIGAGIDASQQVLILQAAKAWNDLKLVTFKRVSVSEASPDALRIFPATTSGLCATTQPGHHATNTTYLAADCTLGQIIHEFGHVLGLRHEQSRVDRDSYIAIDESKIAAAYRPNFDTLPGSYDGTRYDPCSIMHYGNVVPGAWTTTGNDDVWFNLTALGAKLFAACRTSLPPQAGCRIVGQRCAISPTDKAGVTFLYK